MPTFRRPSRRLLSPLCVVALLTLAACGAPGPGTAAEDELPLQRIQLPEGFHIEVYAADVPNARSLTRGAQGTIFVGSRTAGAVYALVDANGDQKAETVHVLAEGLNMPNGVAFRDGDLFVAEVDRILRFDGIEQRLGSPPKPVVVYDDYPDIKHHGWKFIAFGPDGWLYVPVGAPCNICASDQEVFASITRLSPDLSRREVYAHGVRNTVGFAWHPTTGNLWFTDNGRDMLGDDRPPDELNVVTEPGQHFGYPWCHGGDLVDPELGEGHSCASYRPPVQKLGPHVAALGMRFYTGEMFPAGYRGDAFIAEHGSWNRSVPIGYRVMRVGVEGDEATSYEVFAEGWLQGEDAWGRPVDVLVMPDGALLVSDDKVGAVYRIWYGE